MRISFSMKIGLILVISIAVASLGIFGTTLYFLAEGLDKNNGQELLIRKVAVQNRLDGIKKSILAQAFLIGRNQELARAVESRDDDAARRVAKSIMQKIGSDFLTVTDAKGVVVARGHSDQAGDSVLNQKIVTQALAGKENVGLEAGEQVKQGIRGGAPLLLAGNIVGTITMGADLGSHDFVDQVKRDLGVECTIFQDDTRASTSIINEGKRAVGTKMDNQAVLQTVLRDHKELVTRNKILGQFYDTIYWPLTLSDGSVGGMLFIGKDRASIEQARMNIVWGIIITASLMILLMAGAGLVLARTLTRPISQATEFARVVAQGRLDETLAVQRKDEVGVLADSLRAMVASLKTKISEAETATTEADKEANNARQAMEEARQAKHMAEQAKSQGMLQAAGQLEGVVTVVTSASGALSSQIEQSNQGAQDQSHRVSEAATAMEEMTATVLEVARNASQAAESSARARDKAQDGSTIVGQVVCGIQQVQTQASELKEDMNVLGKQSESIGQIMDVISDIADQTNLLALNAAIEAARAGDAGRGFAVVADEVRKLAEKTMAATKEVGEAIKGIQSGTRKNMDHVDGTVRTIQEATALAMKSGETLREIVAMVDSAADQVRSIATASEQQSAASEEINRSIELVAAISLETAQGMTRAGQAVTELTSQARVLQTLITEMKTESSCS